MIIYNIKKFKYPLILLGIFFFHAYMNYEVLYKSEICRIYDNARIIQSLRYYNVMFLEPNRFVDIIKHILTVDGQAHPPLYITIQALVCKILEIINKFDENSIALTTNMLFLFILLISVYGIGARLYNKKIGIVSAFLVSFFPMVFGHSRNLLLDFPLACMTALSFYLLFETNKFQSLGHSIMLGIVLGLSQLTKESFISFIFFPFAYYFYKAYKNNRKGAVLLNFVLTLLCAAIIVAAVYIRPVNFFALAHYVGKAFFINIENKKPFHYYFKNLLAYTGTFIAIAVIPPLISYIRNLKFKDKTIFLWFFAPLIIFSLSPNKAHRFIIPVLPALALIVVSEVYSGGWFSKIKIIYVYCFISLAVLQYSIYFLDLRFLDRRFYRQYFNADFPGILSYRKDKYYSGVLRLLEFFREEKDKLDKSEANRYHRVLSLVEMGEINCPLDYKLLIKKLPFYIHCPQVSDEIVMPASNVPGMNYYDEVLRTEYIIDISGQNVRRGREDIAGRIMEGFKKYDANFKKIAEIEIFDGSRIYIYKNLKINQ